MRYSVKKFKMEHLNGFKHRSEQVPELEYLKAKDTYQDLWEHKLPIFTLFADKEPILIYGMCAYLGTYTPMVFAAEGIDKHRFYVVRCLYDYVEKFVGDDVRRFEATVLATDKKANRLAQFFGFEAVGIKRQASIDGQDQILYERLWRK